MLERKKKGERERWQITSGMRIQSFLALAVIERSWFNGKQFEHLSGSRCDILYIKMAAKWTLFRDMRPYRPTFRGNSRFVCLVNWLNNLLPGLFPPLPNLDLVPLPSPQKKRK